MKKLHLRIHLIILISILIVSCSSDNKEIEPIEEPEIINDTHSFIALRNDGQLFEIGGESGRITKSTKVSGVVFNTLFNTLTSSANTRYFYEQIFDPISGFLYVQNRDETFSRRISIELPEEVYGSTPGFTSLDWYESGNELIGFVTDRIEYEEGNFQLVGINIETFEITNYGEIPNLQGVRSTTLVGSNLYISSQFNFSAYQFQVLNLLDKNLTSLSFSSTGLPPIVLSNNPQNNKLFGFVRRDDSNLIQSVNPIIFTPDSQSYEILSLDKDIAIINVFGK